MTKKLKVGIIGAGAAGITAAIFISRFGGEVFLFEQLDRVGKKILATGNGRCNMTNTGIDISRFHGENPKFAFSALKEFSSYDSMDFFHELGVLCKEEDGGKVYPYSDQASSVLDVLRYELESQGIKERVLTTIEKVSKTDKGFVLLSSTKEKFLVDKVVIATGGKSSPKLGSKGIGYKIAKDLGHSIINPVPALVQLKLDYENLKAIKGVKFIGNAAIISQGKTIKEYDGEILFTDYGISGPPILQLSRTAMFAYNNEETPYIKVDMFKDLNYEEFMSLIKERLSTANNKPIDFALIGLINKKLIPIVLKDAGIINLKKLCKDISKKEIESLCKILKGWTFKISGCTGWEFSQVTAGGVNVKEVNPKTLESKIIKGLFFAGEVLDIDGDCGGFNLQWAWSSGYLVANNIFHD
ncbi:NAD(P)/FAD-dependent oxidoreductase [Clostridium cylindrosporum]|uniref:Flavoprotein, HI0933 family n=1 Tax=Clostridium cylindrosporum DSM 605 TaxID=1121307 RepID=A0A0J8DFZ3_CLOCY|nr:NAD(P)/FAD-dependent oxidoreductase [Clostridium cylindrosporum]KMT23088.1 hypothetical protein CLCY_7c01350 [Clostridium cylindrosporum DSM 605]